MALLYERFRAKKQRVKKRKSEEQKRERAKEQIPNPGQRQNTLHFFYFQKLMYTFFPEAGLKHV